MEMNKIFPKFLGEGKIGFYFISSIMSLKTDENMSTLWIDLKTEKKYFKDKVSGDFNLKIIKKSSNGNNDFILDLSEKLTGLYEVFKGNNVPILEAIEILKNPEPLKEKHEDMYNFIKSHVSQFSDLEFNQISLLQRMFLSAKKMPMSKLLADDSYDLLFGNLTIEQEYQNNVATQKNADLKSHDISEKTFEKYFSGIVLSEKTLINVMTSLGVDKIISNPPSLPKNGGAIFIDMGGTGKSMMKAALKKFWQNELGGSVAEKDGIAEFSGDVNYATLIRSWYYGSKGDDNNKLDKNGLFNDALKNKVPSLLIVDEADRFIKSSNDNYEDRGADLIVTEFKKYLTGRDKGGVQGYVLTLFIANVEERDLNPQLSQGGERLTPVYFGPPKIESDWLELINIYFKLGHLEFVDRNKENDKKLANLILKHNSLMSSEKFMIAPRKFGSNFCEKYVTTYFKDEVSIDESKGKFANLFSNLVGNKNKKVELNYNDFMKNFIDDFLLNEVKKAGGNVENFRHEYYNFVGLSLTGEESKNNFSKQEQDELNLILNDEVVKRIIGANYIFEVLGINDHENFNDSEFLKKLIVGLNMKVGAQNYQFKDLNNTTHKINTDIAKELLGDLFKKIPDTRLDITDINKRTVPIDFSKYY